HLRAGLLRQLHRLIGSAHSESKELSDWVVSGSPIPKVFPIGILAMNAKTEEPLNRGRSAQGVGHRKIQPRTVKSVGGKSIHRHCPLDFIRSKAFSANCRVVVTTASVPCLETERVRKNPSLNFFD